MSYRKKGNSVMHEQVKREVRLKLISLDYDFDPNCVVTDSSPVIERTGAFSENGVFSERIFGRLPSTGREYSCNCPTAPLEGRFYEGVVCTKCNAPVTCRDTVFSKKGWVDLNGFWVISPYFYTHFARVIGPSQLVKILQPRKSLTIHGLQRENEGGGPFDSIGMLGFVQRWEEILDHFEHKRRSDVKVVESAALIREHIDKAFTQRIKIFSHILRPALVVNKKMVFDEVNNLYNLLIANVNILKEYSPSEVTESNVNTLLWQIQIRANEIMKHILRILAGKGGYMRGNMLGVRINFSSRCVITPLGTGYQLNQLKLPYLSFLELFRFQLINILQRMYNISPVKANEIWHSAQTTFDPIVYATMRELIKRTSPDGSGIPALINRNPTIAFGSILMMRIIGVKPDMDDYTMSVPNGVLKLFGGDYDGDVIAIIPMLDQEMADAFNVYDPRLMAISRDGPFINRAMILDKDTVLGLHVLTEGAEVLS